MVPEAAGLRAGPGRCQAGPPSGPADLLAGPDRAPGRTSNRGCRPPGRPGLVPRPGARQRRSGDRRRCRRGREREKGPGRLGAHQESKGGAEEGRGGRTTAMECSNGAGRKRRRIGRHGRPRAAPVDSSGGEVEEVTAERKALFDLLYGLRYGGDSKARSS